MTLRLGSVTAGAVLLLVATSSLVLAQNVPRALRVETFAAAPFVVERGDGLTGFSIELWEEVAARLKVKTVYEQAPTANTGFEALRANRADLGVAAVFITVERDREFDFSYAILEAGQQVMVRGTGKAEPASPLGDMLHLLISRPTLAWLGIGVVLLLIPAHVVWFFERRHKDSIIPAQRYFPGIFHAAFWCAATLLTQAEQSPRQWLARVVAVIWMFTGIVFVALYTAQLTANLTVQQISGAINGPEDLPGKRVGTVAGSVAGALLREHNIAVQEFSGLTEMYQALLDDKVNAVVLGAPVLRYYEAHEGKGLTKLVGPEFHREQMAIVFPRGSPLRREVNSALVSIREDGTYQRIYSKWFGSEVRAPEQ